MVEKQERRKREQKIQLSPLKKEEAKITKSVKEGDMVAVLSGMEMMYIFYYMGSYHCFIHPFDSEEGRRKAWEDNERNTAMLDNLSAAADQLFLVKFDPTMNLMGVMVAAEKGIISFLDMTGQLPAEDMDFMSWQNPSGDSESDSDTLKEKEKDA